MTTFANVLDATATANVAASADAFASSRELDQAATQAPEVDAPALGEAVAVAPTRFGAVVAFAQRYTMSAESDRGVRSYLGNAVARTVLVGVLFALFTVAQGQMMLLMNPANPAMGSGSSSVSVVDEAEVAEQERIAVLSEKFDCRVEGFGEGVYPARALVRFPDKFEGRTRVVSFDRAWGVVEGSEAGTVVAFCRR